MTPAVDLNSDLGVWNLGEPGKNTLAQATTSMASAVSARTSSSTTSESPRRLAAGSMCPCLADTRHGMTGHIAAGDLGEERVERILIFGAEPDFGKLSVAHSG